jgi:hypothetical protein
MQKDDPMRTQPDHKSSQKGLESQTSEYRKWSASLVANWVRTIAKTTDEHEFTDELDRLVKS